MLALLATSRSRLEKPSKEPKPSRIPRCSASAMKEKQNSTGADETTRPMLAEAPMVA